MLAANCKKEQRSDEEPHTSGRAGGGQGITEYFLSGTSNQSAIHLPRMEDEKLVLKSVTLSCRRQEPLEGLMQLCASDCPTEMAGTTGWH